MMNANVEISPSCFNHTRDEDEKEMSNNNNNYKKL